MASVFTFDPDPPRVSSPWSTPGTATPRLRKSASGSLGEEYRADKSPSPTEPGFLEACGISKLDPEPQDGPTEYKLHLLLRARRPFLSLTSGYYVSGSCHSKPSTAVSNSPPDPDESIPRPIPSSSSHAREHRLHQLTTQLLWRLQQSSPFHSSSTANLVLPVLPSATPTLDPPKTLSPLPPGLEESQGALYEIGVSDDGAFVGLAEDEMNESLVNLEVMAASLGCKVEVLRKVAVGYCEWAEEKATPPGSTVTHTEKLWVAEALVSPDLDHHGAQNLNGPQPDPQIPGPGPTALASEPQNGNSQFTEQLHIAIAGATGAGKSSLLGILSTSAFDNGRGKSRLSLLRHRHEIASGVTSSIAQELVGYSAYEDIVSKTNPDIINYASGNVASWNDIHGAAGKGGRVLFISDLPGSLRYVKSTLRGLVSLKPHYVLLCVPANGPEKPDSPESSEVGISLAYLDLCVKLGIHVVVVITKLDAASRSSIRLTLAQVLSSVKTTGRRPVMLPVPGDPSEQSMGFQNISPSDRQDAKAAINAVGNGELDGIPIVITSAVTGAGIGKLHAVLRSLPIPPTETRHETPEGQPPCPINQKRTERVFDINEVFEMPLSKVYSLSNETKKQNDRGIVLCGRVRRGIVSIGDRLVVGPLQLDTRSTSETNGHSTARPKANYSRSLPDSLPSSRFRSVQAGNLQPQLQTQAIWQEVRVVSVRNLRLPVKALFEHQIGTIGIDPVDPSSCLGRIRKGMLLADFIDDLSLSKSLSASLPRPLSPPFHTGFVARFPATDFNSESGPPLVSGGNAVVYIEGIRAAAKVILVEAAMDIYATQSTTEPEIFTLDAAADTDDHILPHAHPRHNGDVVNGTSHSNGVKTQHSEEIRITFSFVASVEWIEVGSRILAVAGTGISTPSPSSSSLSTSSRGIAASYGLKGLVGWICEVPHT